MNEDAALLRRYASEKSEAAFAELVRRHLDLVYSAALRRLGGDAHRAADVAQQVFTTLARDAEKLSRHGVLTAWLYTATHNAAIDLIRSEQRRATREQEASTMQTLLAATPDADWAKLRPVLDHVMDELSDADRTAVLLRFFEKRPFADIGVALNLSEDAARMRVDRALEKLHALLAQRGITSTGAALGVILANQAVVAAPAGLLASITGGALAGVTTAGGTAAVAAKVLNFMSTTKLTLGVAAAIAVAATAVTWQQRQTNAELRNEIVALRQQTATTATLRTENQRLVAEKNSDEETARTEHEELVQLRAAREAFRQRQAAAGARGQTGAANPRAANAPTPTGTLTPGMVSLEMMQNVGTATPTATAQTIAWGLQHADTKTVAGLLAFDPTERQKLEAFIATLPEKSRAEYGTPEQVVALLMAGSPRPIAGVQLLSRTQPDPDTEVQIVQWQYQSGEVTQNEIKFHRDENGWKQIVSPALVDRVIAYFKGKQ